MTPGQKNVLIFGNLALGFAFPVLPFPALRPSRTSVEFFEPAAAGACAGGQPQRLRHHVPTASTAWQAGSRHPGQPAGCGLHNSRHGYLVGSNRMIRETNDEVPIGMSAAWICPTRRTSA